MNEKGWSMPEYVIEGPGKVPRLLSDHTDKNPLAIVSANSADEAVAKFLQSGKEQLRNSIDAIPIANWGFTGTYTEPEGENEPICMLCIEEDGGFTGEELELDEAEDGPCWRCQYLLRESGIEYLE
jgi:hypothetical protein